MPFKDGYSLSDKLRAKHNLKTALGVDNWVYFEHKACGRVFLTGCQCFRDYIAKDPKFVPAPA